MGNKNEIPHLPTGWTTTVLEDVLIRITNGSSATQYAEKIGYPITRIETIWNETIDLERVKYVKETDPGFVSKYRLKKNDILLSHINSDLHLGKTAIFRYDDLILIHGINLLLLRPTPLISSYYLNYYFKFVRIKGGFIDVAQRAVNQSSINQRKLKAFIINIAPLPEQRAIVAKIEQLFSELDNGITSLKKAREQLKVYRQAVLKWAFEGKLTEKWREENRERLETAQELLAEIKKERQKRYEEELADFSAGKIETKPKPPKEVAPLTEKELGELPKLPEGWGWCFPEEVCSPDVYAIGIGPFGSNLKVTDYRQTGIPLIFVRNITRKDFDSDLRYISDEKFKELLPHSVSPLDILITKMGDPPGDCAIYPKDKSVAVLTSDCLKFRVWDKYSSRQYFKYCIESNLVKMQLGVITRGVAQKKISVERFKTVVFPFASKKEQFQIVQEIESRLSIADNLEQTITENLQKAEALRQSILKKAFEGKLLSESELEATRQEPDWEPAEKLLERIKGYKKAATGEVEG